MRKPIRILLQTTIPSIEGDWHIGRFSLLHAFLAGLTDEDGEPLAHVTARDHDAPGRTDSILPILDSTDFDELWLFVVDGGGGLSKETKAAISRFRLRGGGLLLTRELSWLCSEGEVEGSALTHRSGADGDCQEVIPVGDPHELLTDPDNDGVVRYLPATTHEEVIEAPPDDPCARVIATGRDALTGREFNLAVAIESSASGGPAVLQSSFHHFADYNWDPTMGAPSSACEPPGDGLARFPEARRSTERYVHNLLLWLAGRPVDLQKWRMDQALDEALRETFPASDPISITPADRPR
jgi:hypothetical protein